MITILMMLVDEVIKPRVVVVRRTPIEGSKIIIPIMEGSKAFQSCLFVELLFSSLPLLEGGLRERCTSTGTACRPHAGISAPPRGPPPSKIQMCMTT